MSTRRRVSIFATVIIGVLLCAGSLWASGERTLDKAALARAHAAEAGTPGPASDYIEMAIVDNGQFTIGVPNGGPILLFGHPDPWSSFTSVRVDGIDYHNNEVSFGTQIQAPTTSGNTNEGIWQIGSTPLRVHQIITLVDGASTGHMDTYLIQYKIENLDSASHVVGCRILFDTDLDDNDGAPFRVPGTGSVTYEQQWDGAQIPGYFFVFNDLETPSVTAEGALIGGQIAHAPDHFQIADWTNIYPTYFDYMVDPSETITYDSAYAPYWVNRTLGPGQSITFSTYFGLGGITVDTEPPLVTALTAPETLDCVVNQFSPDPFTVSLFLSNTRPGVTESVTGITATLTLPDGLTLAAGSATQTSPDLQVNDSQLLSWQVSTTGTATGSLTYSINLTSDNAGTKLLTKSIDLPVGCLQDCSLTCTANAGASSGTAPLVVPFTATATPTACSGTPSYSWDFGDGATSTSQNPTHVYFGAQTYTWTLTVTLGGQSCSKTGTITVSPGCNFTASATVPGTGNAGTGVTFQGNATPCYFWDFGDGHTSNLKDPNHTYASPGTYHWTMTAWVSGTSSSQSGTITITDVPPPVVTSMRKAGSPFRIIVMGSNLQNGIRVYINGSEWTGVTWKNEGKLKIGGSGLKTAVPRGESRTFRFVNPDGGEYTTTWQW